MHIVDAVQGVHIHAGQVAHGDLEFFHHLIEIEVLAGDGFVTVGDLFARQFIAAAVDGVHQRLGQIGAGAEELHLLADAHRGNAAGNAVVVAQIGAHQVVVLILDGGGGNGNVGCVVLEGLRQAAAPQHGQVRFRRRPQVFQGMQIPVGHLSDHVAAVHAHAGQRLGDPGGVAGEKRIVDFGAQEADHAQFHDKMIYKFLNLFFGVFAALEVALGIDIQEGGSAAQAHGCAVLFLDGG